MIQTSAVKNRNEWIFENIKDPLKDKEGLIRNVITQMLNKSTRMFKYEGLPETIAQKDLETLLQVGGFAIFAEADGKLYAFQGGLGGVPNPYYLPTQAIVANPALRFNKTLDIDKDCVVMLNDNYYQGVMPIYNKYGRLLIEAEISLKYAIINARVPALVQADNDNTASSAKTFFDKIESGDGYGIIATKEFFEGIESKDFYKQPYIKDLIESIQYIKGSWYNEIGLRSAFNMKREAINESEASLNDNILYPFVDTMLECRKIALEKINAMFGTNITVELDCVWADNKEQEQLTLEQHKAEVENLQGGDEENDVAGNSDDGAEAETTTE